MIKAIRGREILLDSGRAVYVDLIMIQSKPAEIDITNLSAAELPLLFKRMSMDGGESFWGGAESAWGAPDPFHFLLPDPWPDDDDPVERVVVDFILWSEPVKAGFEFSELMVILYLEWSRVLDLGQLLQETLRDIDWNGLAVDRCQLKPIPEIAAFSAGYVNGV